MARVSPAPVGVGTAVAAGAVVLTQGAGVVVGLALFVGVFVLVGVAEVLGGVGTQVDLLARASMVGLAALTVIAVVGEPLRLAIERASRMRTALTLARGDAPMPPAVERHELLRGAVRPPRVLLGITAAVAGALALALIPYGLVEEEGSLALAGVVLLAVAVVLGVGAVLLGRAQRRWDAALVELHAAWPDMLDRDLPIGVRMRTQRTPGGGSRREPSRRPSRVASVLGAGATLALTVLFVGVLLRQPCRTCEPVAYDPFGESIVDGVATLGLLLTAVILVAIAVRGVWRLGAGLAREVRVGAQASRGSLDRTEWIDAALVEPRALEVVARGVGIVAMALLALVVTSGASADFLGADESDLVLARGLGTLAPLALAGAIAALLLGAAGVALARRWRTPVWAAIEGDPFAPSLRAPTGPGLPEPSR